MSAREQDRLMQQLLDGEISAEDFEALQEILLREPAVRRRFYEYAKLWQGLGHRGAGRKTLEAGFVRSIRASQHRRTLRQTLLAAAAALVLIAVALRLIPAPTPPAMVALRASEGSLFTVAHSQVVTGDPPRPGTMEIGSVLELKQGTVELDLESDVTAVVRAPARITVHREDRLYLDHGTAWFRVGKKGKGFSVFTPELEVIDLGTEFGVICTKEDHDEAHCFDGKVRVRGLGPRGGEELLESGDAVRTDPTGQLRSTPLKEAEFLRTLPQALAHLHWSFDGADEDRISPTGDHPVVGHLESRWMPESTATRLRVVEGRFGDALRFDDNPQYILTDWPGVLGDAPRSVAMWIKLPPSQRLTSMHLAAWGEGKDPTQPDSSNGAFFVGLSRAGGSLLPESGAGGLRSVPIVSFGELRYFCLTADVHDGGWHHLAWVYHGGDPSDESPPITFYFNGEPQQLVRDADTTGATSESGDSVNTRLQNPLVIGNRLFHREGEAPATSVFVGELDELYLFEGAVTQKTVTGLFTRNRID